MYPVHGGHADGTQRELRRSQSSSVSSPVPGGILTISRPHSMEEVGHILKQQGRQSCQVSMCNGTVLNRRGT